MVPDILKIENVNFVDGDPQKPLRQLFGYAISAKRYALYEKSGSGIHIEKASGHRLGYLYSPKEKNKDLKDEEVPDWIIEAWDFLLRKELGLRSKIPSWLDPPALMRMVVTTPNVLKGRRPEWLGPFNFFLFPLLSELGGYPFGFDKSNFLFITPFETDRRKWRSLKGINLFDGLSYQIAMVPTAQQNKVIPESFRIILRQYVGKPEVKSLAPDGTPCIRTTHGLLLRTKILAGQLIPVGKETERRWEHGEDLSMVGFKVHEFRKSTKMVVSEPADRKRWRKIGVRTLMRKSGLSQRTVYAIIDGQQVRLRTFANFKTTIDARPQV